MCGQIVGYLYGHVSFVLPPKVGGWYLEILGNTMTKWFVGTNFLSHTQMTKLQLNAIEVMDTKLQTDIS